MPISNPFNAVCPVYTIDACDRLTSVNAAWLRFTQVHGEPARTFGEVIGRSIWELMPAGQARQLWEVLFQGVRSSGAPLFVPMRADTPDERRLVDIELRPLPERAIQHTCERVWTERRPAVALLDPAYPRDERTLRRCAWCSRVEVRGGVWEEIECAQRLLGIEAAESLPRLLTVACGGCAQSVLATIPGPRLRRARDAGT